MGLAINEKYIDFEDVEISLNLVTSLLEILHGNYFNKRTEDVEKEPFLIVNGYERYNDLLLASLGELQTAQEKLEMAARNCERETVPNYSDLSEANKGYINAQIALLLKEQSPPMGASEEEVEQKEPKAETVKGLQLLYNEVYALIEKRLGRPPMREELLDLCPKAIQNIYPSYINDIQTTYSEKR